MLENPDCMNKKIKIEEAEHIYKVYDQITAGLHKGRNIQSNIESFL